MPRKMQVTRSELRSFRQYCAALTDEQVRNVVKKEYHANRLPYAHVAVSEAEFRGLVTQYNVRLDRIFD